MSHSKLPSLAGLIGAAVLVAAVGPGAAATAFAADPGAAVTLKVSIADLNMSSVAGAREALARIQRAARQICGGDSEPSLTQQMQYRSCVSDAVQRAVAAMRLPTLTAVSQGGHVTTAIASAEH